MDAMQAMHSERAAAAAPRPGSAPLARLGPVSTPVTRPLATRGFRPSSRAADATPSGWHSPPAGTPTISPPVGARPTEIESFDTLEDEHEAWEEYVEQQRRAEGGDPDASEEEIAGRFLRNTSESNTSESSTSVAGGAPASEISGPLHVVFSAETSSTVGASAADAPAGSPTAAAAMGCPTKSDAAAASLRMTAYRLLQRTLPFRHQDALIRTQHGIMITPHAADASDLSDEDEEAMIVSVPTNPQVTASPRVRHAHKKEARARFLAQQQEAQKKLKPQQWQQSYQQQLLLQQLCTQQANEVKAKATLQQVQWLGQQTMMQQQGKSQQTALQLQAVERKYTRNPHNNLAFQDASDRLLMIEDKRQTKKRTNQKQQQIQKETTVMGSPSKAGKKSAEEAAVVVVDKPAADQPAVDKVAEDKSTAQEETADTVADTVADKAEAEGTSMKAAVHVDAKKPPPEKTPQSNKKFLVFLPQTRRKNVDFTMVLVNLLLKSGNHWDRVKAGERVGQ